MKPEKQKQLLDRLERRVSRGAARSWLLRHAIELVCAGAIGVQYAIGGDTPLPVLMSIAFTFGHLSGVLHAVDEMEN